MTQPELAPGDLCVVVQIGGIYCPGFTPGAIVTLLHLERCPGDFDYRWRCFNREYSTAWALPRCLRKLPPDQFTGADFDWRELLTPKEVAA
jgi:hypothetical protein